MARVGVIAGFALMLLGFGSNQLVYYSNGGMPVADIVASIPPAVSDGRIPLTGAARFTWLADIFYGPWGYASIGDVLLALGLAVFAVSALVYMADLSGKSGRRTGQ